jgi:hypothetical protein
MIDMLRFDEPALRATLRKLSLENACALGLSSAARLLPFMAGYRIEAGLPETRLPQEVVAKLWVELLHSAPTASKTGWAVPYEELLVLMPDESAPWNKLHPLAEDGFAALAYVVLAWKDDDQQSVVYALRRLYEAADQLAIQCLGLDQVNKHDEVAILSAHCVQQELARQGRDLLLAQEGNRRMLQQISSVERLLDPPQ